MSTTPPAPTAAPAVATATGAGPGLLLGAAQAGLAAATSHTVLLGSAGTGKTTALLHALARASRRDGPGAVLGLTSTRSAARQWAAQLGDLLDGVLPPVVTVAGLATRELGAVGWDELGSERDADAARPRVLTAPEQEARIREILQGTAGSVDWPAEWKPALGTRSFARRLRRAVAHARRLGWDPPDLQRVGRERGDPLWVAVGQFLEEYLSVLDWEGSVDHAEVVLRAERRLLAGLPSPFGQLTTIVADDVQEWGPGQARLVLAVGAPHAAVLAAADPDSAAASYRGADLRALTLLRDAGAEFLVADTAYRGGARMRDARAALMGSRWPAGLPAGAAGALRRPAVASHRPDPVTALEFDDDLSQSHHVADRLRRAHRSGVPWREMAVLATSPAAEIPVLARALAQARIPMHVPAGDVPLAEQPAVATLLRAVALVLRDDWLTAAAGPDWQALATSDLAGLPAGDVRRLVRWVRANAEDPDGALLGALTRDPALVQDVPPDLDQVAHEVLVLGQRLTAARRCHDRGGTPAEVLWPLWHGVGADAGEWPERLRRRSVGVGEAALAADRQLDAVVAVFRLAERAPERWGGRRGLRALVEEIHHQEIPAEPDLNLTSGTDAVSVLSLHRAAGRAWPLVVAVGLTETAWRASPLAGGPLDPGRLTDDDLLPVAPATDAAERRRLCNLVLGRANRELVVCAAGGPDDPPTPLLTAAGLPVQRVQGLPPTPRTPTDLLLRLRRTAALGDPPSSAAARSALPVLLAAATSSGALLFPGMAAECWPGARDWTVAPHPLRRPDRPLSLSASALQALDTCPLRWFLQREVRADRPAGSQAGFGLAVHDAAAELVRRGLPVPQPERQAVLDTAWRGDGYDADWHEQQDRERGREALDRAHTWLAGRCGTFTAELAVDTQVPVTDEAGAVVDRLHVRGSVDLLERTSEGFVVWDYKTRRTPASRQEVAEHVQLAGYQAAVAAQQDPAAAAPVIGAGLVQLCVPAGAADPAVPKVATQPGLDVDTGTRAWAGGVLRTAAAALRDERYPAQPGPGCRTCAFRAACPTRGNGVLS